MASIHPPPTQRCRSCQQPIFWAVSEATGKRMPVDAATSERGNVQLAIRPGVGVVAKVLPKEQANVLTGAAVLGDLPLPLRLNHYVSCPQAKAWRAAQRARKAAGEPEPLHA